MLNVKIQLYIHGILEKKKLSRTAYPKLDRKLNLDGDLGAC